MSAAATTTVTAQLEAPDRFMEFKIFWCILEIYVKDLAVPSGTVYGFIYFRFYCVHLFCFHTI